MPRMARKESCTKIYHVTARGINKLDIFETKREKERFVTLLKENIQEYEVEIFAYCIMSNHLHLLIKSELSELSKFMAKILALYAQYFNYIHGRMGYVFQNRYHSECIEDEYYFWSCLRYIHLNPVKANIARNARGYKYSSMSEYCLKTLKKNVNSKKHLSRKIY